MLLWTLLVFSVPFSKWGDGLTLLAPSSVFEGDSIVLTCWEENNRKKQISFYKDGKKFSPSDELSSFPIQGALLSDSGIYFCTAASKTFLRRETSSEKVKITVQELFPRPVLTASSYQPTEGSSVTLTCQTQLPPERSDVQLRFCFFRDDQVLGSGWSSSPELQIPALGTEDSGSYWCQAETVSHRIRKQSLRSQIHVRRVPVSKVSLETQAPGGQVIEGGKLVLLCSVAEGTGNITFSWHREATGTRLGKKTQGSLSAELEIPAVKESDGGKYLCRADNGHDPVQSQVLNILVRIPVSSPVLTLGAPRAQAEVGDVVELHCEALRGSPPILYQFYHEDVTLGNSSAPSGGGASFNLSLTAEHSGNYSCEADNGQGAQRSKALLLLISGPDGHRKSHVTAKVLGGLFGVLGSTGVALLCYCWSHKAPGESSAINAPRDYHVDSSLSHRGAASLNPQGFTHPSLLPDSEDLQPEYVNVSPGGDEDVVYSQIYSSQQPEGSANIRTSLENKDFRVIYTSVKKS
ncbi:Fc receptor-like protein 2 [Marmota marmota marmota]|uniref:Fc receptor-like protein 2 n=1 Tax=Marmota marmota marmota TaxID=9994 RepID=UPI002091EB8E|nr:Fc receptor-like protein 2 [Marmota marmota marmota]